MEGAPIASADLYYPDRKPVFCDGTPHDLDYVDAADAQKRKQLNAHGYKVVAIRYDRIENGIDELAKRLGVP